MFPIRKIEAKKGDAGKVLVIGGSKNIHGAPLLAGFGALAAGIDLLHIMIPARHEEVAKNMHTNAMIFPFAQDTFLIQDAEKAQKKAEKWADAVVIGCGFSNKEIPAVCTFLQKYLGNVVIDAGALQMEILENIRGRKNILLTPHSGEFERVFSLSATEKNIEKMAKKYEITLLKKGNIDIISSPEKTEKNKTGCPQMAVGGTGDVLAGICGGYMAQKKNPFESAVLAAKYWGKAGEKLAQKKRVFSAKQILSVFEEQ